MASGNVEWEGLVQGDVVQYKDRQFLFNGMNLQGGPGMSGIAEPIFSMPKPSVTYEFYIKYFLRNNQNMPGGIPTAMLESEPPVMSGHLNYTAFLNATRSDLRKVEHISEDRWREMIKELQNYLAKSADKASKSLSRSLIERGYTMNLNANNPHLVSRPPIFGVGGCGCGCAPAFQFYLDEKDRIGVTLPAIYEPNFWQDDEQRSKQRSLEESVKGELGASEVVMIVGDDPKPEFLKPFFVK